VTGADEPVSGEVKSIDIQPEPATPTQIDASDAPQEPAAAAAAVPEAVAAPEMVDVWRPGGRSDDRRPRHDRSHHRHQDRSQESAAQPVATTGEASDGAKHQRHGRGRRDRNNDFRKSRTDAPVEAVAAAADGAPAQEPRENKGRPPRERFEAKGRDAERPKGKFGGGREKGGRENGGRDKRSEGGPSHRQFATSAPPPRERDRPIDPNSPFAKLAALKEQLTARKDQR